MVSWCELISLHFLPELIVHGTFFFLKGGARHFHLKVIEGFVIDKKISFYRWDCSSMLFSLEEFGQNLVAAVHQSSKHRV